MGGRLALVGAAVALAAGAGGTGASAARGRQATERQMAAVVRVWSTRLNAKDNAGLARLYALPTVVVQGPYEYLLKTRAEVARFFSLLPCSGKVISISFKGNDAIAVFRLGNRGATKCDAPGGLAAAEFGIVDGKIHSWVQIPVPAKKTSNGQPVA